ncbi:MAG: TetR/AcrR family transcriptional regulator [Planctomycetes bacterium]|nr:TetR/AcrR family transcriptional regulator [Planctomycetota bacterium]
MAVRAAPRRMHLDERRDSIVAAAMRLFAQRGFEGAKSREIGRAAGVSEAMVYKAFPTKKSLYVAIIEAKMREPGARLDPRALAALTDEREFFGTIATTLVERVRADDTFLRLLYFSALEGHALSSLFFRRRVDPVLGAIAGFIRRGIRARRYRRVSPELAARAFLGSVLYHHQMERLFGRPVPARLGIRAVVADLVGLLHTGLGIRGRGHE